VGEDILKTLVIGEDITEVSHKIMPPNLESMNNRG
jgi:hypothetical protein